MPIDDRDVLDLIRMSANADKSTDLDPVWGHAEYGGKKMR